MSQGTDRTVVLRVRLTPRAAHARIDAAEPDGEAGWPLRARVRAVSEKGLANAALPRRLAEALALPLSAVRLESGGASREKRVRLEVDPARVGDALRSLASSGGDRHGR